MRPVVHRGERNRPEVRLDAVCCASLRLSDANPTVSIRPIDERIAGAIMQTELNPARAGKYGNQVEWNCERPTTTGQV